MKYQMSTFFSESVLSDDEFDNIFSELLQVEPPPALVQQILASLTPLPRPQGQTGGIWDIIDDLVSTL